MTGFTNTRRGPPTNGFYNVGDVCQDSFGITWECYDSGFPGLWIGNLSWNWAQTEQTGAQINLAGSPAWSTPMQTRPITEATPSGADSVMAVTGAAPSTMPWPFPAKGALAIVGGAPGYGSSTLESAGSAAITGAAPSVLVQ